LATWAALVVGHAQAQEAVQDPADEAARPADVHVNDSFLAHEELRRIDRLAERGMWAEAATRYQRLVEQQGDKLIEDGQGLFVNLAGYVGSRVAVLPAAGLRAYRVQFETAAREAMDRAFWRRDVAALLRVVEDYFATQAAMSAAERAAELLAEAGHFDRAAAVLSRLIAQHPDQRERPPETLARLGILLAWAGRAERARSLAGEIQSRAPDTLLRWGGVDRLAVEVLGEQVARPMAPAKAEEFSWPTLSGSSSRDRVIESAADAGAAVWSLSLEGEQEAPPEPARAEEEGGEPEEEASMIPSLAAGVLCVQDAWRVWAIEAASGRLLWLYESPDQEKEGGQTYGDSGGPELYSCTLADGRVYAVLGAPVPGFYGTMGAVNRSALLCLDAAGQVLWTLRASDLGHAYARVQLNPAPVVEGGKVFLTARRRKTSGLEDCFLVRADAGSGRLDWQVHVGSAAVGGYGFRIPTLSPIAWASDTVLLCTNLGSLAAVDAWTGRVQWLRRYERIQMSSGPADWPQAGLPAHPWDYHPVICWRDSVVALPADGMDLLVVDRRDGGVVRSVPRSSLGDPVTLLGVIDDRLLAVGRELVCWDLAAGRQLWSRPLPESPLRGRAALNRSSVYWPCRDGLVRWDLRSGASYATKWALPGMAGNLLLTPHQLFVVSADRLTLLEGKDQAFARLRERIAAAPSDPRPLLDLADVAMRAEELVAGSAALLRAIELAGGFAALGADRDQSLRLRVYRACMEYAEAHRRRPAPAPEAAMEWYRRAVQCAPTIAEQVTSRFRLAATLEEAGRATEAIRIYGQILADRSLREQEWTEDRGSPRRADAWAAERIHRLIETHGRQVYEPLEREAVSLLARGRQAGDVQVLRDVVDRYPNSRAAAAAGVAIGQLEMLGDKPLDAARTFYRTLTDYPREVDGPAVIMLLATCYRQAGRPEAALAWLSRGSRDYPQALVVAPGEDDPRNFARIAQEWRTSLPTRQEHAPTLSLPLTRQDATELPPGFELLEPRSETWSAARRRLFFGYVDGGVYCCSILTARPVWSAPAASRVRPALLALMEELAVLTTKHEVFAVRLKDGTRAWTHGRYPADVDKPETDPEWFASYAHHVWKDGRLISVQDNNSAACIDAGSGAVIWEAALPLRPGGPLALGEEFFVFSATVDGGTVLCVMEAGSGKLVRQIEFGGLSSIPGGGLQFTAEGTLLVVTTKTMSAYDPHGGELIWHVSADKVHQIETLAVGIDGIFISEDGQRMLKRGLADGRVLWTSLPIDPEAASGTKMTVALEEPYLFVSTERHATVIDAQDGRLIREEPPLAEQRRYLFRRLLGNCFLAIEAGGREGQDEERAGLRLSAHHIARPEAAGAGTGRETVFLGEYEREPEAFLVGDHALLMFLPGRVDRWLDDQTAGQRP